MILDKIYIGIKNALLNLKQKTQMKDKTLPESVFHVVLFLFKIIIISLLVIFVLYYAYFAGLWILEPESGVVIKPFQTDLEKNLSGEILAGLLMHNLHLINESITEIEKTPMIHYQNIDKIDPQTQNKDKSLQQSSPIRDKTMSPTSLKGKDLKYTSEIGTIGIEGNTLSIGNTLLSMRELNSGNSVGTITGHLQKFGSTISLIAFLEEPGNEVETWEVKRDLANQSIEELMPDMVKDLAYQIYHEMSKEEAEKVGYPQKYDTFRLLVEGWNAYLSYNATRNVKDLENATSWANLAMSSEPLCLGSYELLCELGRAYEQEKNETKARNVFQNITSELENHFHNGPPIEPNKRSRYQKVSLDACIGSNPDDSDSDYKECRINLDPSNPDIQYQLGYLYYYNESYEKAYDAFSISVQLYDRMTKLDPEDNEAWFGKGKAFQGKGHTLVKQGIRHQENGDDLSSNRAFKDAIDAYRQSNQALDTSKKPNEKEEEGWNWYLIGRTQSALDKSQDAISAYDKSIKTYGKIIQQDPKNENAIDDRSRVLFYRAEAFYSLKRYDKAIEAYEQALQSALDALNYDIADKARKGKANALYQKGELLYGRGEYKNAIVAYNNATALDPLFIDALDGKIKSLINIKNAEGDNTDAIDREIAGAWYEKGDSLLIKGDDLSNDFNYREAIDAYEEAAGAFDTSLELNDSNEWAGPIWYKKGKALDAKGKIFNYWNEYNLSIDAYVQAAEAFNQSFKLNPWNAKALHSEGDALFWKAYNLFCLDENEKSIQAYEEAIHTYKKETASIEADNGEGDAWYWKGRSLESAGRFAEAIVAYNKSSFTFYKTGRYNVAILGYSRYLKLDPSNAEAWYGKGNSLNLKGNDLFENGEYGLAINAYEDAVKAYDRSLGLNSSNAKVWNSKGDALFGKARTLEYSDEYNKSIDAFSEAISAYDRCIDLDFSIKDAYYNKAKVLERLGKIDEADEMREMLQMQNSFEEERDWLNMELKMMENKAKM